MSFSSQFSLVSKNLAGLGQYKMLALLGAGALMFGVIVAAAFYLNRPTFETLYVGLQADDVTQMSTTLGAAAIPFKVGPDGKSISVSTGQKNRARMLLADRGLPSSTTAGYELFDNVGSLGLTSFMQEVTRVRALEGEIGRTIQSIDGITAARVHLVMAERGNFRIGEQKPTASIMVRAAGDVARRSASAVRHLVAASVPGLSVDDVTILDSGGRLLASGDDPSNSSLNRSLTVTQTVQSEIQNNIDKALAPVLGLDNFRTSVTADLNTDSQQIQETVYDPDSQVERSVRVTKENEKSARAAETAPATVESNIPDAAPSAPSAAPKSNEENQRKEEQTTYEINSKTTSTKRNSYRIDKLSIAVVLNRERITAMLGGTPDDAQIDAYVARMQQLVATAAGLDTGRGDQVNLTVMNFLDSELPVPEAAGSGLLDSLAAHMSGIVNALAFIVVAFLVVWFGMRPIARSLAGSSGAPQLADDRAGDLELPDFTAASTGTGPGGEQERLALTDSPDEAVNHVRPIKEGPEKRLARMVDMNEERAAKILRKWAAEKAA